MVEKEICGVQIYGVWDIEDMVGDGGRRGDKWVGESSVPSLMTGPDYIIFINNIKSSNNSIPAPQQPLWPLVYPFRFLGMGVAPSSDFSLKLSTGNGTMMLQLTWVQKLQESTYNNNNDSH
ncbi:hypothetical protein NE237_023220 [Protea cynaroides]|uniref:Uncharacterized protein n=1 Tax=Protea cynaroides TaxID=273540 RepID=A0A9Q0HDI9_9MAGN|nr:hypothetical protein NE237_023220 [Protea cynaroides]